jgi:hypothetical protein
VPGGKYCRMPEVLRFADCLKRFQLSYCKNIKEAAIRHHLKKQDDMLSPN